MTSCSDRCGCDVDKPGKRASHILVHPIQVAVTKEAYNLAQMLYLAGCNINPVNLWMEGPRGASYVLPVSSIELREWLESVTSTPAPLKILTRATIRKILIGKSGSYDSSGDCCGESGTSTCTTYCDVTRSSNLPLPKRLGSSIDKLPLPTQMKQFLLLSDLSALVHPQQLNPCDLFDDEDYGPEDGDTE